MSGLEALQGRWRVETLEIDGAALPPATFAKAEIVVSGDDFVSNGIGAAYAGKVSVDARARPAAFGLSFESGPETGRANHGIYEIDGDRWRFCLNIVGGPAPRLFATSPGSGCALQTLVREP